MLEANLNLPNRKSRSTVGRKDLRNVQRLKTVILANKLLDPK